MSGRSPQRVRGITPLLGAAMAIFLITVGIGIPNGLDLVEFDRNTLLTHVHAGTLGWITLTVFAGTALLLSDGEGAAPMPRLLRDGAIVAIALYVVTFWIGGLSLRPVGGALALIAIGWFFGWSVAQARRVGLTVPRLSMLAALGTLAVGAVFGLLLGLEMAGKADFVPEGLHIAHPTTLVIGYLILAGMAIDERWLMGQAPGRVSRWGIAQVVLLFLGGLTLTVGAILDSFPLLAMNVPLEVAGVVIFLVRMRRSLRGLGWLVAAPERQFGLSAIFLAANVGLLAYLIASYADRIEQIPPWLIFALDHSMFVGVMTNAIFGLLYDTARDRPRMVPWAEHVTFWGMNLGMVGFVVGLILREAILKRIFTPIMGASILVGLAACALRLAAPSRERAFAA